MDGSDHQIDETGSHARRAPLFASSLARGGTARFDNACIRLAIALLSACAATCQSDSHDDNTTSKTHFLQYCDASCPAGLSCICGVCSAPCSSDGVCRELAPNASCEDVPAGQPACGAGGPAQACELTCQSDTDCAGLSAQHQCNAGHCRTALVGSDGGSNDAGTCECTGPRPLPPNFECPDGSLGGPVCMANGARSCAWVIRSCPDAGSQDAASGDGGAVACQPSECTDSAQCPLGSTCVEAPKTGPCTQKSCCPALGCYPMCPHGIMRDAKGCETCQCAAAGSCRVDADCPALELCVPCGDAGTGCADYSCVNDTCTWVCPA